MMRSEEKHDDATSRMEGAFVERLWSVLSLFRQILGITDDETPRPTE